MSAPLELDHEEGRERCETGTLQSARAAAEGGAEVVIHLLRASPVLYAGREGHPRQNGLILRFRHSGMFDTFDTQIIKRPQILGLNKKLETEKSNPQSTRGTIISVPHLVLIL